MLNTVLAVLLPYLFVFFVAVIEMIMYVMGYLDSNNAAQLRGDESLLPIVIVFTLIFTTAFLWALIFGNRMIYRQIMILKSRYIAATVGILVIVFCLDMIILDPLTIMWRFKH